MGCVYSFMQLLLCFSMKSINLKALIKKSGMRGDGSERPKKIKKGTEGILPLLP